MGDEAPVMVSTGGPTAGPYFATMLDRTSACPESGDQFKAWVRRNVP
jgi:hypothetical protein